MNYPVSFKDIINQRFGRLVVIRDSGQRKAGQVMWECRCDCGGTKITYGYLLRSGGTSSCGCLSIEKTRARSLKHGRAVGRISKTYWAWARMISRCTNPRNRIAKYYIGRGISVCAKWRFSFPEFLQDMGECPPGKSLDRINNDGNYEPVNCRWATQAEQMANVRSNRGITYNGETKILAQIARETGIARETIAWRLNRGWSIETAISAKPRKRAKIEASA